jgi:hypothetical protein
MKPVFASTVTPNGFENPVALNAKDSDAIKNNPTNTKNIMIFFM